MTTNTGQSLKAVIIDDEPQVRRLLRVVLEPAGYVIHEAEGGRRGLVEIADTRPDVVILDLGLPDMDGTEVIQRVREWSGVPILVLSVREGPEDKVRALDLGADDYLTKPFDTGELLARLRAIQRRALDQADSPVVVIGHLEIDLAARLVHLRGREVQLTATEYALLRVLVRHVGKVVTQRQLLREVWGPQSEDQAQYLRVYMTHLRKKVDPDQQGLIRTEPRIGYRLISPEL